MKANFTYSSTDNFWSPIPVSDYILLRKVDTLSEKEMEMIKTQFFNEKQQKV